MTGYKVANLKIVLEELGEERTTELLSKFFTDAHCVCGLQRETPNCGVLHAGQQVYYDKQREDFQPATPPN